MAADHLTHHGHPRIPVFITLAIAGLVACFTLSQCLGRSPGPGTLNEVNRAIGHDVETAPAQQLWSLPPEGYINWCYGEFIRRGMR